MKKTIIAVFMCCSLGAIGQDTTNNEPLLKKTLDNDIIIYPFKPQEKDPVSFSQINLANDSNNITAAKDIPAVLEKTPGIIWYSDGGLPVGYSQLRLRGLDQFRINMTVNGIPINDAETNGFYTNNFTDILSSASSIQVQRGIGLSGYGSPAYGGSIHVQMKSASSQPSALVSNSYGSFNTRRNMVETNTGIIKNLNTSVYTKLSNVTSDGYRQHSGVNNFSYVFSTLTTFKNSYLKFNFWGGNSASNLAYYGSDKATLETDRTASFLGEEEKDRFNQHFMQTQWVKEKNNYNGISASLYHVIGNAPYFNAIFPNSYAGVNLPDAIVGADTFQFSTFNHNYRLQQKMTGGFFTYKKGSEKINFTGSLNAFQFTSRHFQQIMFGEILPAGTMPGHLAYDNTGIKTEVSAFGRLNYKITSKITAMLDVQYRFSQWEYSYVKQPILQEFGVPTMQWNFVNPKAGINYQMNDNNALYVFAGMISREPTRSDYLKDDKANSPVLQSDINPEKLIDIELGYKYNYQRTSIGFNLFYMDFSNQIASTGKLNDYGMPINQNTGKATRYGAELDAKIKINSYFEIYNSSAFLIANIKQYAQTNQVITDTNMYEEIAYFNNTPSALSPKFIINQGFIFNPTKWINMDVQARYVSSQFLDNTGSTDAQIEEALYINMQFNFYLSKFIKRGNHVLSFAINNVTNQLYNNYGNNSSEVYVDPMGTRSVTNNSSYFPAATRNFLVTYTVKF